MSVIAWNEISKNANGGTEQCARALEAYLGDRFDDFQIIPSRVRELDPSKYRIYWLHDLPNDPETNHLKMEESRNRFHKMIFCSTWQRAMYQGLLQIPLDQRCQIIETPIDPLDITKRRKKKNEIRLIYTSTPQRGLEILVPVFIELAKKYDNIYLDVFSSFKIYGFDEADKQFEPLFKICEDHPRIVYHGAQPNAVVRRALINADIFAYPSIWMECNSRSLIEAMSAGLLCVHSDLAGLSDTAGGMTHMYPYFVNANDHAHVFYQELSTAIDHLNDPGVVAQRQFQKEYADRRFNSDRIMKQWETMLENTRIEYHGNGIVLPKEQVKRFEL